MARPALAEMWTLKAFCSWGPLRFEAGVLSIGPPDPHQGYPGRQSRGFSGLQTREARGRPGFFPLHQVARQEGQEGVSTGSG